jgi:hemolysin III
MQTIGPAAKAKGIERTVGARAQLRPLGEELASAAIQGAAAVASAVGLVYLVTRASPRLDALGIAALAIYGASMFIAFLTSALYHGVQHERIKPALQEIDHCTIFLLIAGTYTPVALLPLRHHDGVVLLASIWALAVLGIVLRLRIGSVAIPLYLVMGWLGLGWSVPLYRAIGTVPALLMIAGGLSYTGGLLFYRCHRLAFSNSMWHLCVVAGSVWFFTAISRFVPM